jgi:hypothetical protein
MNETVRDAVFGNVGTMICFRVSADDAPILVKQFEPQFEANDLLQMHNRSFVINMVIGGEKTPAFSARTLELPPAQTDNTPQIIENTRRLYSRSRSEVEQEITLAIQPPQHLLPKNAQSASQAKQWPLPASAKPATTQSKPAALPAATPTAALPDQSGEAPMPADAAEQTPPKKKRTRTRKRKSSASSHALPPVAQTPSGSPQNNPPVTGETEIKLR